MIKVRSHCERPLRGLSSGAPEQASLLRHQGGRWRSPGYRPYQAPPCLVIPSHAGVDATTPADAADAQIKCMSLQGNGAYIKHMTYHGRHLQPALRQTLSSILSRLWSTTGACHNAVGSFFGLNRPEASAGQHLAAQSTHWLFPYIQIRQSTSTLGRWMISLWHEPNVPAS